MIARAILDLSETSSREMLILDTTHEEVVASGLEPLEEEEAEDR
jgi:hypothetical protein